MDTDTKQAANRALTARWLSAQGLDLIGQTPDELDWVYSQFAALICSGQPIESGPESEVKK